MGCATTFAKCWGVSVKFCQSWTNKTKPKMANSILHNTTDTVSRLHETAGIGFPKVRKDELTPVLNGEQHLQKGIVDTTLLDQLDPVKIAGDGFLLRCGLIDVVKSFLAGMDCSKPGKRGKPTFHDKPLFLADVPFPL